jgi:hypothetical protein
MVAGHAANFDVILEKCICRRQLAQVTTPCCDSISGVHQQVCRNQDSLAALPLLPGHEELHRCKSAEAARPHNRQFGF